VQNRRPCWYIASMEVAAPSAAMTRWVAAPSGHDAESHRQRRLVQIEDPVLATTSVIMTVVFVAAYNFQISLAMSAFFASR
jgi:hypothetical protein